MNTYKIVLLGDSGVGKTSFLKRHMSGEFRDNHIHTIGCEVEPIHFNNLTFNVWDCAGSERYKGLGEGYYLKAAAGIIFFDVTNMDSFQNVDKWITTFTIMNPEAPIIICGNKCDSKDRIVKPKLIKEIIDPSIYTEISAKTGYNLRKPFEKLENLLNN